MWRDNKYAMKPYWAHLGCKNLPEERQEGISLLDVQGQIMLAFEHLWAMGGCLPARERHVLPAPLWVWLLFISREDAHWLGTYYPEINKELLSLPPCLSKNMSGAGFPLVAGEALSCQRGSSTF